MRLWPIKGDISMIICRHKSIEIDVNCALQPLTRRGRRRATGVVHCGGVEVRRRLVCRQIFFRQHHVRLGEELKHYY